MNLNLLILMQSNITILKVDTKLLNVSIQMIENHVQLRIYYQNNPRLSWSLFWVL